MTQPVSQQINQDEINAILWKACDAFRGTIDPAEYKNYILVMLFLKYISDVWRDHYARYLAETGDEERARRKMRYERFVIPEGCDFYTLYENRNEPDIGERIDKALEAIEEANIEKLEGVFRNISFNSEAALGKTRERNARLKHLLEDFADPRLDMRPSRINGQDVIGNAYEYLIGKFAAGAGKKAGEFYTPPEVSLLLARLLDPQPGERIYDPACGSGSLLIKCANQVGSKDYSLWGQESNGSTWALCMMNMFLHDVNQPKILWGDTLRDPQHLEDNTLRRFNVVVANPPFSLGKWGWEDAQVEAAGGRPYNRFWRGLPPKSRADYAFLSHMIETTYVEPSHNGRVGVIVPHGVLFRGGAEGTIREAFIRENLLDAVVGLPENLFYGTGIPAAILIFKRSRSDRRVLFVDASREFAPGTNQNRLREQDIEKIVQTYRERATVDRYSYLATFEEIEENDFNLNIPRYVDTFEPEPLVELVAVNEEVRALRAQLVHTEHRMEEYLRELGLDG